TPPLRPKQRRVALYSSPDASYRTWLYAVPLRRLRRTTPLTGLGVTPGLRPADRGIPRRHPRFDVLGAQRWRRRALPRCAPHPRHVWRAILRGLSRRRRSVVRRG